MEKINLVELLRDCPNGMELDCTVFDNITFDYVNIQQNRVYCKVDKSESVWFTPKGGVNLLPDAKCVIFPKGKTTWEGFVPPIQFKDGDIVHVDCGGTYKYIAILKQITINDSVYVYGLYYIQDDKFYIHENLCQASTSEIRLATEEEKQKLFDAIKANGYKWNAETKTLEKLLKFKVGDRIRHKDSGNILKIDDIDISDSTYCCGLDCVWVADQDKYELVPNKFDITTLKAFESRVLVRDYVNRMWIPTFWGKFLEDDSNCSCLTTNGCYKYCIPYDGNQHLLGTTNDCNEYYKTWEK